MNSFIKAIIATLSSLLFLCAPQIETTRLDSNLYSPSYKAVEVFESESDVPYKFKKISLISINDQGWGYRYQKLLDRLAAKAQSLGATGLILRQQDQYSTGAAIISNMVVSNRIRSIHAVAIIKIGYESNETKIVPQNAVSKENKLNRLYDLFVRGDLDTAEYMMLKNRIINNN